MTKQRGVVKGDFRWVSCFFVALILGSVLGFWGTARCVGISASEIVWQATARFFGQESSRVGECSLASARLNDNRCQQLSPELEKEVFCLILQRESLKDAVFAVLPRWDFEFCLNIDWNRKRLEPWTPVTLFDANNLPKKFKEVKGGDEFIYPHNIKRGELAIFLGERNGYVTVLHLGGEGTAIERGGLLTFTPTQSFIRQRAFTYSDDRS